ncbi:MAG: hypothetical protein LKCHEGNO_02313 [Burkholderiaceae bacterium]|nr:hypothetical protein [Burkholderiaceae bacterium]
MARPAPAAAIALPLAAQRDWAARLPFPIELGPYRLDIELRPSATMLDRRRLSCVNLEAHRIELRQDLGGLRLVDALLDSLIRLCHASRGCQQGCVEEAYTHSFATGLVEFAQRNPRAWLWFNLLLSEHLPGDLRYDRVVRRCLRRAPSTPKRILVRGHPVTVRLLSRSETGNAFGWYDQGRHEVQLYQGLDGRNLPVVAVHEITHAVHHVYGLDDGDQHRNFVRAQRQGWLGIMRNNPSAWRWLAWTMSAPHAEQLSLL